MAASRSFTEALNNALKFKKNVIADALRLQPNLIKNSELAAVFGESS